MRRTALTVAVLCALVVSSLLTAPGAATSTHVRATATRTVPFTGWSSTPLSRPAKVTYKFSVRVPGKRPRVLLQYKSGKRWVTAGTARTSKSGYARLAIRTSVTRTWRLLAAGTKRLPAVVSVPRVIAVTRRTAIQGWDTRPEEVTAGRNYETAVVVDGPARTVLSQRWSGTTWQTVATTRSPASFGFTRVTIPAIVGVQQVRVVVPAVTGWSAAVSTSKTLSVADPISHVGETPEHATSYSFLTPGANPPETATHWDKCRTTLYWAIDTQQIADPAARIVETQRWKAAFDAAASVTGYSFTFLGEKAFTHWTMGSAYELTGADFLIGFEHDPAWPIGAFNGLGGSFGSPFLFNGYAYIKGNLTTAPSSTTAPARLSTLYLHELGHALGLDHTSDATQVMSSERISFGALHYQAGDAAGLKLLHDLPGQGC